MHIHRRSPFAGVVLFLTAGAPSLAAQMRAAAVADSSPFRALALPSPNDLRTGSGRPGRGYWQQRVDYSITATLDPATNSVLGHETIHYVNRSPEALSYLWLFVEQNLCAPTSVTNVLNQPPLVFLNSAFDFSCQGFRGGLTLQSLKIGGREPRHETYGTTMRVDLVAPLRAGATLDLEVGWTFAVPPQGGGRMGHDGPLYEIAQWYPRVAVFDDVHGWNHEPYIGAGEFYLEYGSFDVALSVPYTYIVAATGQLRNADSVLTSAQRARLAKARTSETPIAVITKEEAGDAEKSRPAPATLRRPLAPNARVTLPMLTWRFHADSVRDFAFAAGPNLRWDASGYAGILVETLYRLTADKWEEANRMGREAIKYYSEQWFKYPYSHATTVEGPIEGMEYPMLTFCPNAPSREEQQWVIAHEFGHEWFPMVVGSNERLYPWMDEGFNTFIDLANAAKYFAGTPYGDSIEVHPLHLYPDHAKPGDEQPLIEKPTEVRDLFWIGYQKPALMMQLLRYEVLGKDRFDAAFREYIRTWAFKHPTPADFFRMMRDQSGMELDWFWRDWVFTTARLDQSVDSVTMRADGGANVHLSNHGAMVMPAELSLTFDDGARTIVKLPVEMWNLGDRFVYQVPEKKRVRRVEVDPRRALPDIERANNLWPQS